MERIFARRCFLFFNKSPYTYIGRTTVVWNIIGLGTVLPFVTEKCVWVSYGGSKVREGNQERKGISFGKIFVSVTQHTGPHASKCAYPSTMGQPGSTQPASMLTEVLHTCNMHTHMRVGQKMPQP